jgi:8-oxo-dGTP diphosphatase
MSTTEAKPLLHVAVGVILKNGQLLISLRQGEQHLAGLWEFPGGKVESGEHVFEALARELHEELGLDVIEAEPLVEIRHDYEVRSVLLDCWLVTDFEGEAQGKEGQQFAWVLVDQCGGYPMPAPNVAILEALATRLA